MRANKNVLKFYEFINENKTVNNSLKVNSSQLFQLGSYKLGNETDFNEMVSKIENFYKENQNTKIIVTVNAGESAVTPPEEDPSKGNVKADWFIPSEEGKMSYGKLSVLRAREALAALKTKLNQKGIEFSISELSRENFSIPTKDEIKKYKEEDKGKLSKEELQTKYGPKQFFNILVELDSQNISDLTLVEGKMTAGLPTGKTYGPLVFGVKGTIPKDPRFINNKNHPYIKYYLEKIGWESGKGFNESPTIEERLTGKQLKELGLRRELDKHGYFQVDTSLNK
jgi:hypothetical protein